MKYLRTCAGCGLTQEIGNPPTSLICKPCAIVLTLRKNIAAQNNVDDVAVQRLLTGSTVHSTRAERQAATATLTGWGMSASQIAARLHVSARTVERLRARAA